MDETPRVRRRWLWFGLPVLLGLVALVAIGVSWFAATQSAATPSAAMLEQAERQRAAVGAIRRLGGTVVYDYEFGHVEGPKPPPPGPTWLRERYGVDMVANVVNVGFGPRAVGDYDRLDDAGLQELEEHLKSLPHLWALDISGKKVTDAGLKHLAGVSQLTSLNIYYTLITDSGLDHIQGLTRLESLHIHEAGITDAALKYLTDLHQLKRLALDNTHVTEEGAKKLREALPNCKTFIR